MGDKAWLVSITFGLVALAFFVLLLPSDITWGNVGSDGADYMMAAKYLRIAHPTGEPLYIMAGALWLRIVPFGSEWFRFALLSTVFSAATVSVLYYSTRSALAPLVYMTSAVVISQSQIIELYTMTAFFCVLGWHLHNSGHRGWGYAVVGLALAVHHLAGFLFLGLMAQDYIRKENLKPALMAILVGLPFYLYIPLANREPFLLIGGNSFKDYLSYFGSQSFLWGGMAVVSPSENVFGFSLSRDAGMRLWDVARIVGGLGPALMLLIPAIRQKFVQKDILLPFLVILITVYYGTNLDARVYTYMVLAVAFAALLVGNYSHYAPRWARIASYAFLSALLVWSSIVYQPVAVDPHQSAQQFREDLATLPDDATLWSYNRGWEKVTVMLYNFDHGTSIDTVTLGQHRLTPRQTMLELEQAEQEGKLFRTRVVSPAYYLVEIEPTTAMDVLRELPEVELSQRKEYDKLLKGMQQ